VEQNNQATKTKWVTVINTSKSRKQREKRKREHTKFVYPVLSKTDLVWERTTLRSTIMMSNFTKEISKGYKNKS